MSSSANHTTKIRRCVLIIVDSWDPNNGAIARSSDQGATWSFTNLTFKVGGNMPGRGSKDPVFFPARPCRNLQHALVSPVVCLITSLTDINS